MFSPEDYIRLIFNHSLCLLCSDRIAEGSLICPSCQADLPWLHNQCYQCAEPLVETTSTQRCGRCLRRPPAFDHSLVPFLYLFPVDRLTACLKNRGRLQIIELAARLFCHRFAEQIHASPPQLIVPVPLHSRRQRQRGYNQAAEWGLRLSRQLEIPCDRRLCRRILDTPHQQGLTATERRRNLRGAFQVTSPPPVEHIALVDDVITTGSTLDALAQELKKQGISRVDVWCLARTPAR